MTVPELLDLTELDYLGMEEALSSSARGRAFLRMRDRRTRVVTVDDWRRIAGRLEVLLYRFTQRRLQPDC